MDEREEKTATFFKGEEMSPMIETKNAGKKESRVRTILGSIIIAVSLVISGIFWLSMGFIGAIVAVSALFKY